MLIMQDAMTPLSKSDAVDLVKDVFASATERDYTLYAAFLPLDAQ